MAVLPQISRETSRLPTVLLAALLSACTCAHAKDPGLSVFLSPIEEEILQELNLARQSPLQYAAFLEQSRRYYKQKLFKPPGHETFLTEEGLKAVDEAIRFLRKVKALSPLKASSGLSLAARDHVIDQGLRGLEGHTGSDGSEPWERANRYGSWKSTIAENIGYGEKKARELVMRLIIDDGVPDRGHRKNIFNEEFKVVGIAAGKHSVYGSMCVMVFADGFEDRKKPNSSH